MKYAIVLPGGAADEPIDELDGKTPLEAAQTPNMDWIAANGRLGRVVTVPQGFEAGSDVATMSLFGYDPRVYHSGRAPLEAAAKEISVAPDETVFRCNFVTLVDGVMEDFTAGHVGQNEAEQLIQVMNDQVADEHCRFYAGVSYRNLMVASGVKLDLSSTAPHDIPGKKVDRFLPRGDGSEWLARLSRKARDIFEAQEVNLVRCDLGEHPVTDVWFWGEGRLKPFESFESLFDVRGTVIAAVDVIRGIARCAGMELMDVPGATGYLDTDYIAKGKAAVDALNHFDLVVVHIEAPDEAGHQGDSTEKVSAIERIDEHIVGPLLEKLRGRGDWRLMIAPDHPTLLSSRIHSAEPPPFCIAGTGIQNVTPATFCESDAMRSDLQIDPGFELMEFFLRG